MSLMVCFILSRKVKTQLKHTKKFCAVYRDCAVTEQMCQKWFAKFHAGDFSLDNAPRLGRQFEVDSYQIKTLIEDNPYYTTQEIADILKIAKPIKLLMKMKNVSFMLQKKTYGLLANPNHLSDFLGVHWFCHKVEEHL